MKSKIKTFFKENWKFLIFLVCFYAVMTYELPYVIYTPGGAINMSERIKGDNLYSEEGSLSMTYVNMVRGRLPFLLLSYVIPNWDIVKNEEVTYDNKDLDETFEIDKIYMQEAISNATHVALTNAEVPFSESCEAVITNVVRDDSIDLKSGDVIINVDNNSYSDLKSLQEYIKTKSIGDEIIIEYKRNDDTFETKIPLIGINGEAKAGLAISFICDYESKYNISVETKKSEAGPSGGLMTSLAIYNQITDYDITYGYKIMGTGTIDKDGTVGEIGGVKYKLVGAVKNGAKVFIVPKNNFDEALKVKNENNYDIILIRADDFGQVIEELKEIGE